MIPPRSQNRRIIHDFSGNARKILLGIVQNQLSTQYVLHTADLLEKEGILYLPLYMTPLP